MCVCVCVQEMYEPIEPMGASDEEEEEEGLGPDQEDYVDVIPAPQEDQEDYIDVAPQPQVDPLLEYSVEVKVHVYIHCRVSVV